MSQLRKSSSAASQFPSVYSGDIGDSSLRPPADYKTPDRIDGRPHFIERPAEAPAENGHDFRFWRATGLTRLARCHIIVGKLPTREADVQSSRRRHSCRPTAELAQARSADARRSRPAL